MPGWHKHLKEPEVLPPCATCGRTNVCPNCSSILARREVGPPEGARELLERARSLAADGAANGKNHGEAIYNLITAALASQAPAQEKP